MKALIWVGITCMITTTMYAQVDSAEKKSEFALLK